MTTPKSLIILPEPIQDEAPSSWIARICDFHAVRSADLFKAVDLPCSKDPDIRFGDDHFIQLAQGTAVSQEKLRILATQFSACRKDNALRSLLLFDAEHSPCYRFCPICLCEDATPYFRFTWRFKDWTFCPSHNIPLMTKCSQCEASVHPLQPDALSSGLRGWQRSRWQCHRCFYQLSGSDIQPAIPRPDIERQIAYQRAVISAMLHGYFQIRGSSVKFDLPFLAWMAKYRGLEACYPWQPPLSDEQRLAIKSSLQFFLTHFRMQGELVRFFGRRP